VNLGKLLARMQKDKKDGRPFFIISLDVKKAFDSVDRNKLVHFLSDALSKETRDRGVFNVLKQMLNGTQMTTTDMSSFEYNMGVPQGGVLSPSLFTLYMDRALKS
jgi:hypothetical protein